MKLLKFVFIALILDSCTEPQQDISKIDLDDKKSLKTGQEIDR